MGRLRGSQDGGAGARSPDGVHPFWAWWAWVWHFLAWLRTWVWWALELSVRQLDFGTPVDEFEDLLPGAAPPGPSPGSPPFVGLINHGLTCYLNALLQCLFVTPEFRDRVQEAPWSSQQQQELEQIFGGLEALRSSQLQQALEQIFRGLEARRGPVETRALTTCLGLGYGQQDVGEVFLLLLDKLGRGDLQEVFQSEVEKVIRCARCGSEDNIPPGGRTLLLPLASLSRFCGLDGDGQAPREPPREPAGCVQDTGALGVPHVQHFDEDDNLFFCECCDAKTPASEEQRFLRLPKILVLQVSEFTFKEGKFHKAQATANVSHVLELQTAPRAPAAPHSSGSRGATVTPAPERKRYHLYAVCSHWGDYSGGHYTALVQPPGQEQWYHFDDQWVDRVESFPQQFTHRSGLPYLLMYRCQDSRDRQEDEPEDRVPGKGVEAAPVPETKGPPWEGPGEHPKRSSEAAFPEDGDPASPTLTRPGVEADVGRPTEAGAGAEDRDADRLEEMRGVRPATGSVQGPAQLLGTRGPCPALPSAGPGVPQKPWLEPQLGGGAGTTTQDVAAPEQQASPRNGRGQPPDPGSAPSPQEGHPGPSALQDRQEAEPGPGTQAGTAEGEDVREPGHPPEGGRKALEAGCATPQGHPQERRPPPGMEMLSSCSLDAALPSAAPAPPMMTTFPCGPDAGTQERTVGAKATQDLGVSAPECGSLGALAAVPQEWPMENPPPLPRERLSSCGRSTAQPSLLPGSARKDACGPTPSNGEQEEPAEAEDDPDTQAPSSGAQESTPQSEPASTPHGGPPGKPPADPLEQLSMCGQSSDQHSPLAGLTLKDTPGVEADVGHPVGAGAEDPDADGLEETRGARPAPEPVQGPAQLLGARGPCPALPSSGPGAPHEACPKVNPRADAPWAGAPRGTPAGLSEGWEQLEPRPASTPPAPAQGGTWV
ncbi:collagen alpha-1(I) chain-like isoform X2 [Dasypus novemcinctus]|uniref:collagen alpha-1(I) chain-like isoform X2 n=1 Tax=Dasypus novemcinctus TaxID=9361 RepID=UPI00265F2325|nr:basic proline-rich protein-like isoform X2 [Dasypus novemcinctus]